MPLVNVRLIEGVFTPEQKSEMIHQLTETMVRFEGENLRPVTWVIVEEVKSGDWGIGGQGPHGRGCPRSAGEGSGRRPGLEAPAVTPGRGCPGSLHRGRRAAASGRPRAIAR
jgi:4-oxalocrotonate tautomerase